MDHAESAAIDLEFRLHGARPTQKVEVRLWLRMLSITKLISQEIRRRLRAEFGATLPQFDLMAQLYREPAGLRLGELSRRTMVTNGNVTGLMDRLVADGLVERTTANADRRVTVAKLTPSGTELFARMARTHERWLRELMEDVDPITKISMLEGLGAVKHSVKGRT